MATHHDKALYGKLARMQSELSEEEIESAVARLNEKNTKRRTGEKKSGINCGEIKKSGGKKKKTEYEN